MHRTATASLSAITALFLTTMLAQPRPAQAANSFGINIDNFGQINTNFYRGAQPDRGGIDDLKRLGVKTIIDLQEKGERNEPEWVRSAGLQFFKIALSSTRPATAEETAYFLKLVNDPANWPVYVHCAGGRHRTGMMTAIYRITHDGWNADKAFEEMKQFKYYSIGGHGSLKDYVYSYFRNYHPIIATPALAAPAMAR
jgi:protein tyrosine phosphatase (PTP) superfamily phosphohydrolase (DUF442 family)